MRRHILLIIGLAAAGLGIYLFSRVLQRYDFADVMAALGNVSVVNIAIAAGLTVCSFAAITAMEHLAVRYAEGDERTVSVGRIARTAVAALGIGHALGLAALSSGAIRYRMYRKAGVRLPALGEIIVFSGVSVGLGIGAVGGLSLLWQADALAELLGISPIAVRALGGAGLELCAAYLAACAIWSGDLRVGHYRLRLPRFRVAIRQLLFSSLNYACIAGALFFAFGNLVEADYPEVASLYLGAELSALIAHVPGGWGVLEWVFTESLSGHGVVSGLLVFRATYYLLPLFVGLAVWLADEIAGRRLAHAERHAMNTHNA